MYEDGIFQSSRSKSESSSFLFCWRKRPLPETVLVACWTVGATAGSFCITSMMYNGGESRISSTGGIVDSPDCSNRSSRVAVANLSLLPSSSKPTILVGSQWTSPAPRANIADLSFETPFMKVITHGRTLMPSFSTRNGTFSTNTRMKSV